MIKHIKIKNFKAIRDINIELSGLNIFTGLNGMGKSTLIQSLLLIRQSVFSIDREINLNGEYVKLGEYQDVFCEYPTDDELFQIRVEYEDDTYLNIESSYRTEKKQEKIIDVQSYRNSCMYKSIFGTDTFTYLSASRISPSDSYDTNSTSIGKRNFGIDGKYAPHYYHLNKNNDITIKGLAFDVEDTVFSLENQLNLWMAVISPKVQVITEQKDNFILLRYSYKTQGLNTTPFKPQNAGFGLTYVFSVLVAILSSRPGDILIIENPESHIHPKGQSELARLLALAASNGVQVFIETHSDHILYGVRIAIKEKYITTENTKIYYFDRDEVEHFSTATKIVIDEYGRMERSVRKYFDEYESHLNHLMG